MLKELSTQDRTIVKGAYTFNEKAHLHTLDGKPLTGVTTILGVIAKPMLIQWAADMAVSELGWVKQEWGEKVEDYKKRLTISIFNRFEELDNLSLEDFVTYIDKARVAHRKKKESAGEFGTNVHSAIEKWINAQMLDVDMPIDIKLASPMEEKAFNHFVKWATDNKVKFLESEKHVYSREWWTGGIVDLVCEIDGKVYLGDIKTSKGIYKTAYFQTAAYAKMLQESCAYDKFDGMIIINLRKDGGMDTDINYDMEGNTRAFEAALTLYRQMKAIDPNF